MQLARVERLFKFGIKCLYVYFVESTSIDNLPPESILLVYNVPGILQYMPYIVLYRSRCTFHSSATLCSS